MAIPQLTHEHSRAGSMELEIFFHNNIFNVIVPVEIKFFQFVQYFDRTWLTGNIIM